MHDYLDAKKAPIDVDLAVNESSDVKFQFYRKSNEKSQEQHVDSGSAAVDATSSATPSTRPISPSTATIAHPKVPQGGLTAIHLSGVATSSKDPMVLLAEAVEKYNIPDEERFELLCRIRIAKVIAPGHEEEREKLLVARLLAIAIYGLSICCDYWLAPTDTNPSCPVAHTHSETAAMNSLFLYDPELINHITELIQPDRDIPPSVQVAALTVLDALGRYRTKIGEVLGAVNAGVSHGTLMSSMRKTVTQLQDPQSKGISIHVLSWGYR